MYLVRRYSDDLRKHDYGVYDDYRLIGLFSDEAVAKAVMETEKAAIPKDKKETMEIDMFAIEVDKIYKGNEQIFLGGGFYIE